MYPWGLNSSKYRYINFPPIFLKDKLNKHYNLHLVWKYAKIFVYRCCIDLLWEPNSFLKAWLKEKYEPWGTDDVQEQVFKHMVQCKSNANEMRKFRFLSLSIFIEKLPKYLRENSMRLERYFGWTIGEILWDFQHLDENLQWITFFCQ